MGYETLLFLLQRRDLKKKRYGSALLTMKSTGKGLGLRRAKGIISLMAGVPVSLHVRAWLSRGHCSVLT